MPDFRGRPSIDHFRSQLAHQLWTRRAPAHIHPTVRTGFSVSSSAMSRDDLCSPAVESPHGAKEERDVPGNIRAQNARRDV